VVTISTTEPVAISVVAAIHRGDLDQLQQLLVEHPELVDARLGDDDPDGMSRSLLHVATDWPGHYPDVAATIDALVRAGADVNARFRGPHEEAPLHWAASSDDVDALTALLDLGADIEAAGGVIAGGTPLGDATAFGCWAAARTLVARGARAGTFDLAALGMVEELIAAIGVPGPDSAEAINEAFWSACHANQVATARALVGMGAEIDFLPGWEDATPLDIAARAGAHEAIRWLHGQGAHTCHDL
jgi:hypothetical protein